MIKSAAIMATLVLSFQSYAFGKIVFDPTNFSKNLVTAAQTAKTTAIVANQYATQIRQYQLQIQNLKQLNPAIVAAGVARGYIPKGQYGTTGEVYNAAEGVYGAYTEIQHTMNGMSGTYSNLDSTMNDINRISATSNIPIEKVMQYEAERAKAGQDTGKNYARTLQNLNDNLQNHQKRADQLSKQIPKNGGAVDSLATIASQNSLLSDQMTHLIEVSSMQASIANDQAKKAADDEAMKTNMKDAGRLVNQNTSKFFGNINQK